MYLIYVNGIYSWKAIFEVFMLRCCLMVYAKILYKSLCYLVGVGMNDTTFTLDELKKFPKVDVSELFMWML